MVTPRINSTDGTLFLRRCPSMGWFSRVSLTNSPNQIGAESKPSLVGNLCCGTTHGPACNTVAGRTSPFESKSCVIPTFFPRIPATFAISLLFLLPESQLGYCYWLGSFGLANDQRPTTTYVLFRMP